ncbi:MAG TPA: hypothetical protein VK783_02165 [Bacteroidia bacterium]|jgi:hypothetical protein|nr:hypothetical protein [Bacteroidia bacterium]
MHKEKSLTVYSCSACSEVEVKTSTPKIRGCKKASMHMWVTLGEKGLNKFVCENCKVKVNTTDVPALNGCAVGGTHNWRKV